MLVQLIHDARWLGAAIGIIIVICLAAGIGALLSNGRDDDYEWHDEDVPPEPRRSPFAHPKQR